MIGTIIIIALNIFSFITTIISSDIFKGRPKERLPIFRANLKKEKPWKTILLFCTFIGTIIFSIWQYRANKNEDAYNKRIAKIEADKRDSSAKAEIIKSKNETINALAKYGLKYDTAQSRIEKLFKDSSRKNVTIYTGADPIVSLCDPNGIYAMGKDRENYRFTISICNLYAASKNVKGKFHFLIIDSVGSRLIEVPNPLEIEFPIFEKDQSKSTSVVLTGLNQFNLLFVYFKGTYENSDNTKLFHIDQVYGYNKKTGHSGVATEPYFSEVRKIFKDKR